jgi:hypothetical protein
MKGIAKALTNIKPMLGGLTIAQLPIGGWVYGDRVPTDLVNFSHFYRADGTRVELTNSAGPVMCKCYIGNLTLVDEIEPGTIPPPVDTFPSYIPIGAEWQVRFKLTPQSEYTEWFTFSRTK